ncbi:Ulp1 family isopeptidase [Bradyrhizobium sp. USDA 10063]
MESNYNDPNYWMRWYAEQQELQRARQESDNQPADQSGFEQQLSELQLGPSEESSAELSSPDTRPTEPHGSIRRTDVGGSMRMPPRSSLRDDGFGGTRHSVDLPHADFRGSAAGASSSDLRDRLFSSTRYTAPSEREPVSRTRDKKSGGLWSRVKKGFGKAFGGKKSSDRWEVISSEIHVDLVKRSRPSDADVALFSNLESWALKSYSPEILRRYTIALKQFSDFLASKGLTLVGLLDKPSELDARVEEFAKLRRVNRDFAAALKVLRRFHAGELPRGASAEDEKLISEFRAAALEHYASNTVTTWASALRDFGKFLFSEGLTLSSLLGAPAQLTDLENRFVNEGHSKPQFRPALEKLRASREGSLVRYIRSSEDEKLISGFGNTMSEFWSRDPDNSYPPRTIATWLSELRAFADWLQDHRNNLALTSLLADPDRLAACVADYVSDHPNRNPYNELAALQEVLAGNVIARHDAQSTAHGEESWRDGGGRHPRANRRRLAPGGQGFEEIETGRRTLLPYRDDAVMIDGMANEEVRNLGRTPERRRRVSNTASAQRAFSDWLQRKGRPNIVSRLNGTKQQKSELSKDLKDFERARGYVVDVRLDRFRQYVQVVEANRALGAASPGQAGWGAAGSSSTWSPQVPSDFDPNEWPTPEGAPARSSDIYRGLGSLVDLPSSSYESGDDAQSAPVLSPAGRPPFFIGPSGVPQELEDIGYLVGDDWQHGSQPVSDVLFDVLDNRMLLPSSRMAPQPVAIKGETYSIAWGPRGRRDAQLIHHPRPSSAPFAQIGASSSSALSRNRSGRVLDADEWLGDEHIQRDYELLAQELQERNPELAARTRFVDPLIAFQMSHSAHSDMRRALHRIVVDRNGNDMADFLFLPVNDASPTDPGRRGTHWSLLLVDRRDRERRVAYHYDSGGGRNDGPGARLAARLRANLQDASVRQQRNGYDCGVFVVDGTRALVRRLAARRQPNLRNLDNLVVNRRELQDRLRG